MGNKVFYGIIALIVVVFIAIFIVVSNQSSDPESLSESGYYPYTDKEPDELSGPTIDTLDNEDYQSNKTPAEVEEIVNSGEGEFVYFWSPTCVHCQEATPMLTDALDNIDNEVTQLNVLEYDQAWETYGINATPTLIYFEDGEEVERLEGNPGSTEGFEEFMTAAAGE
ncbi:MULTISPECIES: thioredoxin family protein [Jeotgalicoccus]|uniref:thioredoxin family protein n=1 Tax=Jeotgalicoccus TaxID=227979 RepID=UPI000426DE00|nr:MULTISPECIES: thioredoxin family protein [Jeotgalicoccus]QQD85116.1 thioredoxin family protein [Jeotgalicoccus sp. ATCC 8456]